MCLGGHQSQQRRRRRIENIDWSTKKKELEPEREWINSSIFFEDSLSKIVYFVFSNSHSIQQKWQLNGHIYNQEDSQLFDKR